MPGRRDDVPGGGVDGLGLGAGDCGVERGPLRPVHEVVEVALPVRRLADRHGAGHVGVVAAVQGAEVQGDEVAALQLAPARVVVRDGAVRPGSDDRLECGALGAEVDHGPFERDRDGPLGDAGADLGEDGRERAVGDGAGLAQEGDLLLVLDPAQLLDEVAERDQFPSASAARPACCSTVMSWASKPTRPWPSSAALFSRTCATCRSTMMGSSGQTSAAMRRTGRRSRGRRPRRRDEQRGPEPSRPVR